jgi:hypothetical protein
MREAGVGRFRRNTDLESQLLCIESCINKMEIEMERFVDMEQMSFGNEQTMDFEQFDDFCQVIEDAKVCVRGCLAESTILPVSLFDDLWAIPDYMCVDHREEFEQSMPCYEQAEPVVISKCEESNVCGDLDIEQVLEKITSDGDNMRIAEMLKTLDDVCTYTDCFQICAEDTYDTECGSEGPGDLMRDFGQFAMSKAADFWKQMGIYDLYPESCKILSGDIPIEYELLNEN